MSVSIKSQDWSALAFAQKAMQLGLSDIHITLGAPEESFDLLDLWKKSTDAALSSTRMGRIGFLYDESNKEAPVFIDSLEKNLEYKPKDKKRALSSPCFTPYPTQILHSMAELGWEKSIEFRRIARKYIRPMKHAHIDTLVVLEPMMSARETLKVLQHLVGTQIQIITPLDVWEPKIISEKKDQIRIDTIYSLEKTKKQADRILKRKISAKSIKEI